MVMNIRRYLKRRGHIRDVGWEGKASEANPDCTTHREKAREHRNLQLKAAQESKLSVADDAILEEEDPYAPFMTEFGISLQHTAIQRFVRASIITSSELLKSCGVPNPLDSCSPAGWYAALLAIMDVIAEKAKQEYASGNRTVVFELAGVSYVLSRVASRVPLSVIEANVTFAMKLIHQLLPFAESICPESENTGMEDATVITLSTSAIAGSLFLKSVISTLSRLMLVYGRSADSWLQGSQCTNVFAGLFHFVFHNRPPVRRVAQGAFIRLVSTPILPSAVANHAAELIKNSIKNAFRSEDEVLLRRSLTLARQVAPHLSHSSAKALAELSLTLSSVGTPTIRLLALSCLTACCTESRGDEDNSSKPSRLVDVHLAESIAAALMTDFKPPSPANAPRLCMEWLRCVQVAHLAILQRHPASALKSLPRLFETAFGLFVSSAGSEVADTSSLSHLAAEVLVTWISVLAQLLQAENNNVDVINASAAYLLETLENGLGYQHYAAWPEVLKLLALAFEQVSALPATGLLAKRVLPILASLRTTLEAEGSSMKKDALSGPIDNAVGAVIVAFGPTFVLDVVPLFSSNFDLANLIGLSLEDAANCIWLCGLIRERAAHSEKSTMSCFQGTFLPLLVQTDNLRKQTSAPQVLELIYTAVWSTLPAFLGSPDTLRSGKISPDFARLLGDRLVNDSFARTHILSALRRVLDGSAVESCPISRYSKNFLPLLFNLHVELVNSDEASNILRTVRCFFSSSAGATSTELASQLFGSTWQRLVDVKATNSADAIVALLDLLAEIIPRLEESQILDIISTNSAKRLFLLDLLVSYNSAVQKRSYRFLEAVIDCIGNLHNSLANFDDAWSILVNSMPKTLAPAHRSRLGCLMAFKKTIPKSQCTHLINTMLFQEAMASMLELNSTARDTAAKLLDILSNEFVYPNGVEEEENDATSKRLAVLFDLVIKPLDNLKAPSEDLYCASIVAATRLVKTFRNPFTADIAATVIDKVTELSSRNLRSVYRHILKLCRTIVGVLPGPELDILLPRLVPFAVGAALPESRRQPLRIESRRLLIRIAKKCGLPALEDYIPKAGDFLAMSKDQVSAREGHLGAKHLRNTWRILRRITANGKSKASKRGSEVGYGDSEGDDGSSEESDSDVEYATARTGYAAAAASKSRKSMKTIKSMKSMKSKAQSKHSKRSVIGGGLRLLEDADDIVDLADPASALRQHSKAIAAASLAKKRQKSEKSGPISVGRGVERVTLKQFPGEDPDPGMEIGGLVSDDGSDIDEPRAKVDRPSTSKPSRQQENGDKSVRGGRVGKKARGAGGRSGKSVAKSSKSRTMDPYEYVPLERRALNRRLKNQIGVTGGVRKGKAGGGGIVKRKSRRV